MKLRFVAEELYRHFDCKYYNISLAEKKPVDTTVIVDFLIEVHKDFNLNSINNDFIFKYLLCQYDYWKGVEVKGFGNLTVIKNIFGKKAYQRFKDRKANPKFNWYNAELKLKEQYGIDRSVLLRYKSKQSEDVNKLHEDEEREKRFFNDDRRLIHCSDTTTLYKHASKTCQQCSVQTACKELLKVNYPQIYKKRFRDAV